MKQPKDTARYGVQVVYFGEIDTELDELIYVAAGRHSNDQGSNFADPPRRDMFWKCFDRDEAARLAYKIGSDLGAHSTAMAGEVRTRWESGFISVKTEEQYWDEKIKAAVGNGVAAQ